jgi:hypothetical protein
MDVATIVQRVIDLGLNENAPDTGLQAKALGWVNNAYKEAYNVAASYAWIRLYETNTVTITNGTGTLPFYPKRLLKVINVPTKRPLKQSDIGYILDIDPALERTGDPARFYTEGDTTIKTHPRNNTTLSYVAIRQAQELILTSVEADIKIPPHHHELLIWAALPEAMMYERGFGNEGLLQVANARKTILMDNYMREMRESAARAPQRTEYQEF